MGHLNLDIRSDIPNRYYILSVKYFAGDFFLSLLDMMNTQYRPEGKQQTAITIFLPDESMESITRVLH